MLAGVVDDAEFAQYVARHLSGINGVTAVTLGGSRAAGTHRPELAQAREGRFRIERLMFHLAGVPSYIVVAELAVRVVLYGALPSPGGYPDKLRESAHNRWLADARHTLDYARGAHAARGHLTDTAGAIGLAFVQAAHGVLAGRGEWVTNEKTLTDKAGLRSADDVLAGLTAEPDVLVRAVVEADGRIQRISG
jgi:hypothetical protein